eukprot:TRINITY_DN4454_c0_g2_i1.p1 TRINITY_DN4454_c0_g2~~TRINITY_DN4454_c0_g2_i1.p1  ORF type:complete len:1274 (+),score=394.84 TRINITY_DN4454_c0_g2_i1:33-3854(+)
MKKSSNESAKLQQAKDESVLPRLVTVPSSSPPAAKNKQKVHSANVGSASSVIPANSNQTNNSFARTQADSASEKKSPSDEESQKDALSEMGEFSQTSTMSVHETDGAQLVEVNVNGNRVKVPMKCNLVEACRIAGVYVPTLCYHPRLQPLGKCGMCNVQVGGNSEPVLACSTTVLPGMEIFTDTKDCKALSQQAMGRIIEKSTIRAQQSKAVDFQTNDEMKALMHYTMAQNYSSTSLVVDMSKCLGCYRCTRVCRDIQSISVWTANDNSVYPIMTSNGLDLSETDCVGCGQCTSVCPSGAIAERSNLDEIRSAMKSGKIMVAQIAPSVRVSIGELFGRVPGSIATGQLVLALKRAGFHYVFDTNFGADLTILEEAAEFVQRLSKAKPGPFPMFTSCCPGWINYMEKMYPKLISRVSSCKSPQAMLGAVIKNWWAKKSGQQPENVYLVSVMPCTAKKEEIVRPQNQSNPCYPDIDYAMTTRECARFLKEEGVEQFDHSIPFDEPFCEASGGGAIFGNTGGVMEAILRFATAGETDKDKKFQLSSQMKECRGLAGVKTSEMVIGGKVLRVGIVNGIANMKKVIDELMMQGSTKFNYHLIEMMACPGGCIGGGGQPHSMLPNVNLLRANAIYKVDHDFSEVKRPQENKALADLYSKFLEKPGSAIAHKLLHTSFTDRQRKLVTKEEESSTNVSTNLSMGSDELEIIILYATVGGTTEEAANYLSRQLKNAHVNVKISSMDKYPIRMIQKAQFIVFMMCTFGDGEIPSQAEEMYQFLNSQPAGSMSKLSFAVFGLGSSQYPKFCSAAVKFHQRLCVLGAKSVIPLGKGDANAEDKYFTAFEPWVQELFADLGVSASKGSSNPSFKVCTAVDATMPVPPPIGSQYCVVESVINLTPKDKSNPLLKLTLDLSGSGEPYHTGDSISLHPENSEADILSFLEWYHLSPNVPISVFPGENATSIQLPNALTILHLFTRYLDIFSKPSKRFLMALEKFASDPKEKEKLHTLVSKSGASDFSEYMNDNPSHVDVLKDFPSSHPTLDYLIEIIPHIKPRMFTIGSSHRVSKRKIEILVHIPKNVTRSRGKIPYGLATNWIEKLKADDKVPFTVHEEQLMRPPEDNSVPVLMCGNLTGFAALRAIVQHRSADKVSQVGQTVVIHGCRTAEESNAFVDEMDGFVKSKVLSKYIPAFADCPTGAETIESKIAEFSDVVWKVISHPKSHYYCCFFLQNKQDAVFLNSVLKANEDSILGVLTSVGGMKEDEGKRFISSMKDEGRWHVETH